MVGVGDWVQAQFHTLRNVFPEPCTCLGMKFFLSCNLIFLAVVCYKYTFGATLERWLTQMAYMR